ncbi:MAG: hypothetical protein ACEQSH_00070 [Bacteroidia bacterium]|jgi:hypothetical protein
MPLTLADLPKWQSIKVVQAAVIRHVSQNTGRMTIHVDPSKPTGHIEVLPADNMFARYRPVPGDYYVVYDDGYAAISPRKAFEEGYVPLGSPTAVVRGEPVA